MLPFRAIARNNRFLSHQVKQWPQQGRAIAKPFIWSVALSCLAGCQAVRSLASLSADNTPPFQSLSPVETEITTIPIDLPGSEPSGEGGLIVADLTGDGQREFIVTYPQYVAAFSVTGEQLWKRTADIWLTEQSESKGLPGRHGPGVQAGDIDGDGSVEVFYVIQGNVMEILSGDSGDLKHLVQLPAVEAAFNQWEHAILANFRGEGDFDVLLQASRSTDRDRYIRDSVQAGFSFSDLIENGASASGLWQVDDFVSFSHGPARVADLNLDGRDEVIGVTILGSSGETLYTADLRNTSFPHIDSVAIGDVLPERPGLEVIVPEESGQKRVILYDEMGEIWRNRHRERALDNDGDKVAIGDFDPERPGLEIWFRGGDSEHFTVLDAAGEVIASYTFANRQPDGWTDKGFENINRIRWDGAGRDYLVAKERHEAGDVGIFDAMTGQQIAQFPGETQRLFVADVLGDWREEVVIVENEQIQIIQNSADNPNPEQASLWESPYYERQKMTWNYYSP